eukprot:4352548-Amphidinium_carterae.1
MPGGQVLLSRLGWTGTSVAKERSVRLLCESKALRLRGISSQPEGGCSYGCSRRKTYMCIQWRVQDLVYSNAYAVLEGEVEGMFPDAVFQQDTIERLPDALRHWGLTRLYLNGLLG